MNVFRLDWEGDYPERPCTDSCCVPKPHVPDPLEGLIGIERVWLPQYSAEDAEKYASDMSSSPLPRLTTFDPQAVQAKMSARFPDMKIHPWQMETALGIAKGECRILLSPMDTDNSPIWISLMEGIGSHIQEDRGVVLFVSLTRNMKHRPIDRLREQGYTAYDVNTDAEDDPAYKASSRAERGFYFLTPELMSCSIRMRKLLSWVLFKRLCVALIVDDAHMVDVLGDTTDPRLLDIWEATETLSPDIPFLFLSSSAQTKQITTIYDSFRLTCRFISGIDAGSRRDNIFYEIRPFIKPSDSYADLAIFFEPHLLPVGVGEDDKPFHPKDIQDIPCNPHLLPRMIIFVKTLEDCLSAQYALFMLLPRQFGGLIEIYQPPGQIRKSQLARLKKGRALRILIACEAFGVDVDVPNVHIVVQWGDVPTFLALERRLGQGGTGPEAINCRALWFAPNAYFGPLSPSDSSLPTQPVTKQPVLTSDTAYQRRNALHSRDPTLYHMCNPPPGGCIREIRQAALHPKVMPWFKDDFGCEWNVLDTDRQIPLCPERCCSLCLWSYLKFGKESAPVKRAEKAAAQFREEGYIWEADEDARWRMKVALPLARRFQLSWHTAKRKAEATKATRAFTVLRPPTAAQKIEKSDPKRPVSQTQKDQLGRQLRQLRAKMFREDQTFRYIDQVYSDGAIDQITGAATRILGAGEDITPDWLKAPRFAWLSIGTDELPALVNELNAWRRGIVEGSNTGGQRPQSEESPAGGEAGTSG